MRNQSRQENLIYLVVWSLLFAAPLLSLYVRTVSNPFLTFDWEEIITVWQKLGIYLLLFLVHNYLLAPLLVHKHKRVLYLSAATAVLAGFLLYQCNSRPAEMKPEKPLQPRFEQMDPPPPPPPDEREPRMERPPHEGRKGLHQPPPFVGERDILAVVVLLLMFGANLGTKLYFRTRSDQRKLQELERQNLEQQLEYLKYQINPHFFMNTLNNIHALVDIDPEKAQETILELSKMMRFVLYEGNKSGVPLAREFEFIRTYTKLMKLRYTDKVRITVDVPEESPDKTIPPLMLVSFIENAFKHGVSYKQESFIEVKASICYPSPQTPHLYFACRNSKAEKPNEEKGGVGLANVRKRLDLIYDDSYTLDIKDEPDCYTVELIIPLL